jgi:hypothetical protein
MEKEKTTLKILPSSHPLIPKRYERVTEQSNISSPVESSEENPVAIEKKKSFLSNMLKKIKQKVGGK